MSLPHPSDAPHRGFAFSQFPYGRRRPCAYCAPMRPGLSLRMLIGLGTGIVLGVVAHLAFAGSPQLEAFVKNVTEPAGRIFLRLLFMLVLPRILSALALGVAGLCDMRRLGRIGLKTLVYTIAVSTIAVLIGVTMVNTFKPGLGISPELRTRLEGMRSAAPPAAAVPGTSG